MKKTVTTALVILLVSCVVSMLSADGNVSYPAKMVIGDVKIIKEKRARSLAQNDLVHDGEVIVVGEKSLVEFALPGEGLIRVDGPKVFRVTSRNFKSAAVMGGVFSRFEKLTRRHAYRSPMTIVTAVRGKSGLALKKEARDKFDAALELYKSERFDEAWQSFDQVERLPRISPTAKEYIKFFRAGIHYGKMSFEEALGMYVELSQSKFDKFEYREEAFLRAIICADHTGNYEMLKKLYAEYDQTYGEKGKYYELIRELKKTQ